MSTRDWRYFYPLGLQEIQLGNFASGMYDTRLVRDTCANYAQVRRNVINLSYNWDCWQVTLPGPESDEWFHLPSMVVGGRINRPGKLRIYLRTSSLSELAANAIECRVTCGHDSVQDQMHGVSLTWRLITLTLTGNYIYNPDRLDIALKTRGANVIDIWGVCVYQEGGALLYVGNPTWTDLDDVNCALGIADYPDDVFGMKLLRDNCCAVRNYKAPKANVWCQHFNCWHKVDIAYGANNNDLGEYRFVKREGVSEVKLHFLAGEQAATGATARLEISDPDAELAAGLLPAAAQTIAINGAALLWYTITWTFQGADITSERNLALKIDALSPVGYPSEVYIPGVYLVETAPAAAIAHTVPNIINTPMHSKILAGEVHDNTRTTLNHLYYQGGKQILIGDWRFAEYVGGSWVLDFLCQHNAWVNSMGNPAFYNNCVVARALLFSSTSSTLLRSRLDYSTDSTASATKQIQTALSDTQFRAINNYYEADPMYDLATNNIHQVTRVIDSNGRHGIEKCELEIRAADWEEHYDGVNEPPNVHLWAIGAATGYIIPHQYSCEECELHPTDFP